MPKAEPMRARIAAVSRARGGRVIVRKAVGGCSLFSARTGGPIARLRPTGDGDKVEVLRWDGDRRGASGPLGIATVSLDDALDYVASEPAFWPYA